MLAELPIAIKTEGRLCGLATVGLGTESYLRDAVQVRLVFRMSGSLPGWTKAAKFTDKRYERNIVVHKM